MAQQSIIGFSTELETVSLTRILREMACFTSTLSLPPGVVLQPSERPPKGAIASEGNALGSAFCRVSPGGIAFATSSSGGFVPYYEVTVLLPAKS